MPFESLGYLDRSMLKPALEAVPVHALVDCIPVWCRILVVEHPIKRHDRGIELAHQVLSDVVYAMLVMAFVHLRDFCLHALHFI